MPPIMFRCPICDSDRHRDVFCLNCGHVSSFENDNALPSGTVLAAGYVVGRSLGAFYHGYTYIGFDKVNRKLIKIKEYADPEGMPEYLLKKKRGTIPLEIKPRIHPQRRDIWHQFWLTQQKLNLKTIPKILDIVQEYNTIFAIMEHVEGISLFDLKKQLGRNYTASETLSFMRPLIRDMCRMHQMGLLHQNISESGILMVEDRTLKFVDFGAVPYPDPPGTRIMWGYPRESKANDVDRMAGVFFFCMSSEDLTCAIDRPFDGFYWGKCADDVTFDIQRKIEHAMYFSREAGPCSMGELHTSLYD